MAEALTLTRPTRSENAQDGSDKQREQEREDGTEARPHGVPEK